MKVFIPDYNGDSEYHRMFRAMRWTITDTIDDAHLVQFTGGADVSPSLYGCAKHPHSSCNPERDQREALVFAIAYSEGIPMAGICRGGQFLNVMCGGEMYQHATNHTRDHGMFDIITDEIIQVTSTHHQIMKPSKKGEVLAIAWESDRREYIDADGVYTIESFEIGRHPPKEEDVEVVFYRKQKALCFQPHPEFPGLTVLRDAYFDYIEDYLIGEGS